MNIEKPTFKHICYMHLQQLTNFPYIEKDFDANTDYELICKVVDYLNQVIINENEQNESIIALYDAFVELKNYVDNLDLQDEVNNKLDEMAESGQLDQIIEQYLNSSAIWGFDTVADMKVATNLINGSYARTLGYHAKNDGGESLYKIRNITNDDVVDEMFIIEINDAGNNLIAELIYNDINIKQLGAKDDNLFDNTSIIQAAFNNGINKKIYIPTGTYLINSSLTIAGSCHIIGEGENSIIKYNGNNGSDWIIKIPFKQAPQFSTIENIKIDGNYIANGIFDGESGTGNPTRSNFYNLSINACVIAIKLNSMGSNVDNCYLFGDYNKTTGISRCNRGIIISSTDNQISNTRIYGFGEYGLYCNSNSNKVTCVKTALSGVGAYFSHDNNYVEIDSQENYQDNIQINSARSSSFYVTSNGAGIEPQTTEEIPTTLNNYSLIKITNTKDCVIKGTLLARAIFVSENWSCEGYYLTINGSLGLDINVAIDSYVQKATGVPQVVNCDTIAGINLIVNGYPYRTLSKHNPTISGTSNTTKKYQNNNEITFDISSGATSSAVALLSFPIDEDVTNLAVATMLEDNIYVNRITYQYTADGSQHNIYLPITNRLNVYNPFGWLFRIYENIATILENDETYQGYITQSIPITNRKIIINGDLSNYSGNRTNVKGIIDVYYN